MQWWSCGCLLFFLRALFAFLALPGIVAFVVPLILLRPTDRAAVAFDGAIVAVLGIVTVAGWALGFRSATIGWYALVLGVAFHLRVVFFEEPWLARMHGNEFVAYRSRVRRWL